MSDDQLRLDPKTTALVIIDLQHGIAGRETAPHSGPEVIANAARLADRFRELGSTVVLVRVSSTDGKDRLQQPTDAPSMGAASFPEGFDVIVEELGPKKGDLVITKDQWGLFTAPSWTCNFGGAVLQPLYWAVYRPIWVLSQQPATPTSATTRWCWWRTRWQQCPANHMLLLSPISSRGLAECGRPNRF